MYQIPWILHNLSYPSYNALTLFMATLPFLATSLPLSVTQVYFIAHTGPHISDSCTTSDQPSTLWSICNLSLFNYRDSYLRRCDFYASWKNYDSALNLPNRPFLIPLFFLSAPREKPSFHHLFSVDIHNAVFKTPPFILYAVHITLHLIILPFFLNATKYGRYRLSVCNLSCYTLQLLNFLSNQAPLTYAIPGTNHVLVKDETKLNAFRHQHYLQVTISMISYNHPHYQKS